MLWRKGGNRKDLRADTFAYCGASTSNLSPAPLGDQLTKSMIQADLAAKALDPSNAKPNASKFNVFANFGEIKGESTDKDHPRLGRSPARCDTPKLSTYSKAQEIKETGNEDQEL